MRVSTIVGRVLRRSLLLGVIVTLAVLSGVAGSGVARAQPNKLVVIVLENEPYTKIVGSASAPYINSLITSGELFTNYTAVTPGSLRNYLAMTSGLTTALSPPSPNVFQAIDATGGSVTWASFEESMTGNCGKQSSATVPGTNVPLYTRGHDPDYQYRKNTTCAQNDLPLTLTTFNPASLPTFSYIVPNQCDDMHSKPGGGQPCPAYFGPNTGSNQIVMGDNWLKSVVTTLLAQPGVTVLITWDEGNGTSEHIATLEAGAGITSGSKDLAAYNHYSLEAGLYATFALGTAPNNGAKATPLPIP